MYTKKNARVTFKSNRRPSFRRNNNNFSNGKIRNKGNVTQQYNKYTKLAKEAFTSGDRVQSEYYYQFVDHYYRLMVELGINIDDNSSVTENKSFSNQENIQRQSEVENESVNENDSVAENTLNHEEKKEANNLQDESIDSIESIPFIAEPAKKKRTRSSK